METKTTVKIGSSLTFVSCVVSILLVILKVTGFISISVIQCFLPIIIVIALNVATVVIALIVGIIFAILNSL